MTLRGLGARQNTSPANNASWLLAVIVLAVAIPANDKISKNGIFFTAHGVQPIAWTIVLVLGLISIWLVIAGLLALAKRVLSPRGFDLATSIVMLVVTWFLIGNALALTVLQGAPLLAPLIGFAIAVGLTWVTRRLAMGTILLVFAVIAAAIPIVTTTLGDQGRDTAATYAFPADAPRPNVLWIVSDELSAPLVMNLEGRIRPEFPNLRSLQDAATTYTNAVASANYTDYALSSMLNGVADIPAQDPDTMQRVRSSLGIIPGFAADYSIITESPIYRYECAEEACAQAETDQSAGPIATYLGFAADSAAIAGRTVLAEPFAGLFPSLDGKWRDFWAGGDEFGDTTDVNTVGSIVRSIDSARSAAPTRPFFALWHSIRTHGPWTVDFGGRQLFPARIPIVDGAHMAGTRANQTYATDELKSLGRRLYAASAVDFDRQLGQLLAALKANGTFDSTLIVVTADHGVAVTSTADRRFGDDLEQRMTEIAQVPLIVKAPGQTAPEIVTAPRSTGQIARTVLEQTLAADPGGDAPLITPVRPAPGLSSDLPQAPVFSTVAGGVATAWPWTGPATTDPWPATDLAPPDPTHPFAIGIDPGLIGRPVPAGATPVDATTEVLPGAADQQLLVVTRSGAACPTTTGLVTAPDASGQQIVIGSVLWEGGQSTRGWAIAPKAPGYGFSCLSGAS